MVSQMQKMIKKDEFEKKPDEKPGAEEEKAGYEKKPDDKSDAKDEKKKDFE